MRALIRIDPTFVQKPKSQQEANEKDRQQDQIFFVNSGEKRRWHQSALNFDIAAKRRKKHKNKISGLVNSMCYTEQKSKFRLFTNPSTLTHTVFLGTVYVP